MSPPSFVCIIDVAWNIHPLMQNAQNVYPGCGHLAEYTDMVAGFHPPVAIERTSQR